MPARQDARGGGGGGGGGASAAASPTKPAPSQLAKGKGKATDDDPPEEELALRKLLERCVLQAQDADPVVQARAIIKLRQRIRRATGSVTDILKPLKYICPHYETLKALFESMPESSLKSAMAGILSVLALAMSSQGKRESLKYCLMGSVSDISSWGHAYVRNLACEITDEVQKDDGTTTPIESIIGPVLEIVKFHMKHNTEAEALDLLMEVGYLEVLSGEESLKYFTTLLQLVGLTNFKKACLYLTSSSRYLAPDDMIALSVVYFIYMKFGELADALRIGILLDYDDKDRGYVKGVFAETVDFPLKKQFAYMIARYGLSMFDDDVMAADEAEKNELQKIVYNTKLNQGYLTLARDIEVMEPKSPEDIYKVHLIGREAKRSTIDSARQNLAATFVNAFVNAGFCQDLRMTVPSDFSENWLFKNKGFGKTSAVASLGVIYLWNPDSGLAQLHKYLSNDDTYVVAGALLGIGIVSSGVKNDCDTALGLFSEYISTGPSIVRIGAILGLGIAYAGSQQEKLKGLFLHLLSDSKTLLEVLVFSAISLGLVFVGTCNEEIAQSITCVLRSCSKADISKPIVRMLPLALGLLYLGKKEKATRIVEVSLTLHREIKDYCATSIMSLASAGTGNVNMVQRLLRICSHNNGTYRGPTVIGIALIAMGEEIGAEMAIRSLEHLLQYGDYTVRRAVPLALALLFVSNPKVYIVDTLSRLSHDSDIFVSMASIISLGLIAAGTNNYRVARLLRDLSKDPDDNHLFCVRIAQGLVHLGKGLLTLDPCHSDRFLSSPVALAGIVTVIHTCLNMESTILGEYPYMLYTLVLAMQPRMLLTVDEDLEPLPVPVRVGKAVDVAGQAGQPRTISGFRTHNTPVVLAAGERAELATEKYIPLAPVLEGFVILRKNPDHSED